MIDTNLLPFELDVTFAERPWGRRSLSPWYDRSFATPVGEAWLTGPQSTVAAGEFKGTTLAEMCAKHPAALTMGDAKFPLLVKMLFPDEKLSVQVHPDEEQAARLGGGARAKTECWYVLDAVPGATVSIGLREGTSFDAVQAALGSDTFESLLHAEPVSAGDMVYVEAGTVHAIGGGLTLLEVQQSSDTTFRLYDYGRPRELHLREGLAVTKLATAAGKVLPREVDGGMRLIEKPNFTVDRHRATIGAGVTLPKKQGAGAIVGLRGSGAIATREASTTVRAGYAVVLPAKSPAYMVEGDCEFVHCFIR